MPKPPAAPPVVDQDERNRRVEANRGLVHHLAKRFRGHGLDMDDLVQHGMLGLIRAAELYREDYRVDGRPVAITTFAGPWILRYARHGLIDESRTIRLPNHAALLAGRFATAEAARVAPDGTPPDPDAVFDALGVAPQRRPQARRIVEASRLEFTRGATLALERCAAPDPGETEGDVADRAAEARATVAAMLDTLEPRMRAILELRHGLADEPPLTLRAIARRLHISCERVRQVEAEAMARLRREFADPEGDD